MKFMHYNDKKTHKIFYHVTNALLIIAFTANAVILNPNEYLESVHAETWVSANDFSHVEFTKDDAGNEQKNLVRITKSGTYKYENINKQMGSGKGSAIVIDEGLIVHMYFIGNNTLEGGDASGTTGAGAGIEVPASSTVYIHGNGTLNITGGDAASGGDGAKAPDSISMDTPGAWATTNNTSYARGGQGAGGGNGGGGAAAGIGGKGGNGGKGGSPSTVPSTLDGKGKDAEDDAGVGSNGGACGKVYLLHSGTVTINKGSNNDAKSGKGGNGGGSDYSKHKNVACAGGGAGGGGGGKGGVPQYAIGGGGAGGGGGGGGGSGGASFSIDDSYVCGGTGGGAGLEPGKETGGGGGGGGAGAKSHDKDTTGEHDYGGAGGAAGKDGTAGLGVGSNGSGGGGGSKSGKKGERGATNTKDERCLGQYGADGKAGGEQGGEGTIHKSQGYKGTVDRTNINYTYDVEQTPISIEGEAKYNRTLTCKLELKDKDGNDISGKDEPEKEDPIKAQTEEEKPRVTYQWYRDDEPISGAVKTTYHTTHEDIGKSLKVIASYPTGGDSYSTHNYVVTSMIQLDVSTDGDVLNLDEETLKGDMKVGKTIEIVSEFDIDYKLFDIKWYRDGDKETGGTESTYTLINKDIGRDITVTLTGKTSTAGETNPYIGTVTLGPSRCTIIDANSINETIEKGTAEDDAFIDSPGEDDYTQILNTLRDGNSDITINLQGGDDNPLKKWLTTAKSSTDAKSSANGETGTSAESEEVSEPNYKISNISKFIFYSIVLDCNEDMLNLGALLEKDIDMSSYVKDVKAKTDYRTLGKKHISYTGTFDGGGHEIKHINIESDGNWGVGFISYLGEKGIVKNLVLSLSNISGRNYVGGIVGYCYKGKISYCKLSGSTVSSLSDAAGGIVGIAADSTIEGCIVENGSKIISEITSKKKVAGGIVASIYFSDILGYGVSENVKISANGGIVGRVAANAYICNINQ